MTAGDQLRDDMARALAHGVRDAGRPLEFDERETLAIEAAAAAADRGERLAALWAAELAGDTRASVAVKLAAEIRLCEKHVVDLLSHPTSAVQNLHGIEIGGPSACFKTVLPIYRYVASLDGTNFSTKTLWESSLADGEPYRYRRRQPGRQIIAEATDLNGIPSNSYDFLLSSNCLEHIANPIKALTEWVRVVKPGLPL